MNASILEAIKKSAAVPSMPQVVTRFLEAIQDPQFNYNNIVKILSTDPGMVSEVLRLANSALFGVARKVTNLRQALTLLGPKRTRSLVLGRYLVNGFGDSLGGGIDTSYFWRRSLAAAVLGARFADSILPKMREEVFISALLADIGMPILAQALPDLYQPIAARYAPYGQYFTDDEERETVDVTHGEVSAMVLAYWGLPELICKAVNLQHCSSIAATDDITRIARILNGCDCIAKLLCEIPDVSDTGRICSDAAEFMGVDLEVVSRLLGEIENDVEELASILHIDVIPSTVYDMIAKSIQEKLSASPAR
ncbi:MAG: HDOD domain-containing protein [Phycisphaerae bacterium]|nr:HDOD domain-containing protein [Phycisphaerae bacterium]